MSKKLLALDIGKVCISLQEELAFAAMNWRGMQDIPPILLDATGKLECGMMDKLEFFQLAAGVLNLPDTGPVESWFNLILGEETPGMANTLKQAEEEWNFVFLSDISAPHLEVVRQRLSFFDQAIGGIFSFEAGCRKPDRAIFARFEAQYGKPDLFVDDRIINIKGAEKMHWNAVQFLSVPQFSELLKLTK